MKRRVFITLVMVGIFLLLNSCAYGNTNDITQTAVSHYEDIIADYERLVEYRLSDTFETKWNSGEFFQEGATLRNAFSNECSGESSLEEKWSNMIVDMTEFLQSPRKEDFGYILKDINNDGTDELFWVLTDSRILAVFTIRDGRVVLLDAFWSRYQGVITEKNQLYTLSKSGAVYTEYALRTLSADGVLIIEHAFGTNGISTENEPIYYEITGDKQVFIDKEQFEALLAEHLFVQGVDWSKSGISFLH